MSSPRVLRVIANLVEVLPSTVARLACGGLLLLAFGGCTAILIRHDPWFGVVLGVVSLIVVLPETLRGIARRMEARLHPPPRPPDERDPDADLPDR